MTFKTRIAIMVIQCLFAGLPREILLWGPGDRFIFPNEQRDLDQLNKKNSIDLID
jgi:hypothetical protein